MCAFVSEAEERVTVNYAAASLTLSWTSVTPSDAPSTKDEQMGKPLIVHQVPVFCVCASASNHIPVW